MTYAELEIGLHRGDGQSYAADMRFSLPSSDVETRTPARRPAVVHFPLDELRGLSLDSVAYGRLLTESLFADAALRAGLASAVAAAASSSVPLRMRLFIGPSATELHALRWETLRNPEDDTALAIGENVVFSRYVGVSEYRLEALLAKRNLTALVAVAAAPDLEKKGLAAVDAAAEATRARAALGGIPVVALHETGPVTLERLGEALLAGPDVLYLVAHGVLTRDGPRLWLQGEDGLAIHVAGEDLAGRIQELRRRPRLIVLASCQSAGTARTPAESTQDDSSSPLKGAQSKDDPLAALGPRLAEAGVAAVIAMQGDISLETAEKFTTRFFSELDRDGQVDRAAAAGRGAVREAEDWWAPALFMRLKSGRLWYTPGFGEGDFKKWDGLVRSINQGACTAILGPDLTEPLIGSRREVAQRLAETYHFPLAQHDRDDLPQVAQYLAVDKDPNFLLSALPRTLCDTLLERFVLTPELRAVDLEHMTPEEALTHLDAVMQAAAAELRGRPGAVEPHAMLARLPLPLYITTSPDNLLIQALTAAGRPPAWEICRWYPGSEGRSTLEEREPDYRPTAERPLVYQLFGHLSDIDSLVITEDAYFRFLRGVTANRELIPHHVTGGLVNSALLFLGFRLDDWNFRILYRGVIEREGKERSKRYSHVAAQIDPEQGQIGDSERARRYLEEYFQDADIHIFWGSVEDFLRELGRRL